MENGTLTVVRVQALNAAEVGIEISDGTSLIVPAEFVRKCGIREGDRVFRTTQDGKILFSFAQEMRHKGDVIRTERKTTAVYPKGYTNGLAEERENPFIRI